MDISAFMKVLRANKTNLTRQQVATLKGQALTGNFEGAMKGINTLVKKQRGKIYANQAKAPVQPPQMSGADGWPVL